GLISVSGSSYIPYGATLKQTFTSNTGYTSPPSINASMGGQTISNPDYTNEGLLTISNVTGDIVVNASCGAITYTVAYYSNDGNTLITSETHTYGIPATLHSGSGLTPPSGMKFAGWSTSINATQKVYAGSQSVENLTTTNNATIKLYAVWELEGYTVIFDSNCGTGETYTTTIGVGEQYTLSSSIFTNGSHNIFAWNKTANGEGEEYLANTKIVGLGEPGEEITLYAQWTCTATFKMTTTNSTCSKVGFVITNDANLHFDTDSYDSHPLFYSTAPGSDGGYTDIYDFSTGSKHIATALSGTTLYYDEVYYSSADAYPCTYNLTKEIPSGYYVFLFVGYVGEADIAYFSSYSVTSPLTCSLIIDGIYGDEAILKYEMPQYDVLFECKTNYSNYGSLRCFPADTLISSEYGYKNIQDVQVGDMVWTYNEVSGEFELKKVYFTRVVEITTEVIHLGFGDETLTATYNHEFLTQNRGWVSAKELTFNDIIIANGEYVQIISYESEIVKDFYYNFSVEDNHNYLVSNKNIVVDDFYCQQQRWGIV
ncbi:MAG: InlB B-repeat-containing protein, partial [Clostridia bacterium]|nr:InlB B-repeat-containing protein [Clostridia bacterium]